MNSERESSLKEFAENISKWATLLPQVRQLAGDSAENLNVQFQKLAAVRPDAIGFIVRVLQSSLSSINKEKQSDPEIVSHELRRVLIEIEDRLTSYDPDSKKRLQKRNNELNNIFAILLRPENRVREKTAEECIRLFDELVKKRPDRAQLHINNLRQCIGLNLAEKALDYEIRMLVIEGIKLDLNS